MNLQISDRFIEKLQVLYEGTTTGGTRIEAGGVGTNLNWNHPESRWHRLAEPEHHVQWPTEDKHR